MGCPIAPEAFHGMDFDRTDTNPANFSRTHKATKNTKTPETNLETLVKRTTIARISVLVRLAVGELRLVDAPSTHMPLRSSRYALAPAQHGPVK